LRPRSFGPNVTGLERGAERNEEAEEHDRTGGTGGTGGDRSQTHYHLSPDAMAAVHTVVESEQRKDLVAYSTAPDSPTMKERERERERETEGLSTDAAIVRCFRSFAVLQS